MATTRETILTELKRRGGARADELAETLELTPMAVRQHLYQLQDEGAVVCCADTAASGRGRPAKHWELTKKADVYFPDTHRELSLDLIESIRELMGDDGLNALVNHRTKRQNQRYQALMEKCSGSLKCKLDIIAKERSREGYMAEVQEAEDGDLLLLENHCPICEAAKACSGLCRKELELFRDLVGDGATVEREEHMLTGARRCAYRVKAKS
ncbi:helix-turn-helix transcriptional regulator [Kordiimonas gwangyangensis]|uniref:helix-turn-helix transcriptional regulator n=1 Tax=Kordiimonas gwangyangensis TaxID=288022 RepID=UPI0003656495|nr:metalloregulator ArsR/SmtB family transcription factor [Kordiimonas gwangyangensis]